jgi:hypothetical protein
MNLYRAKHSRGVELIVAEDEDAVKEMAEGFPCEVSLLREDVDEDDGLELSEYVVYHADRYSNHETRVEAIDEKDAIQQVGEMGVLDSSYTHWAELA